MFKIRALLGLFALTVLGGIGCWPVHAQDGFPRTVIDASGAPVTIPARPARIAVRGGVPVPIIPPEALHPLEPYSTPDWTGIGLLVLSTLDAAADPALVESARAAGVPVFQAAPVTSLDGWRDTVDRLGRAAGREERAGTLLARLDTRIAALRALLAAQPPRRVLVLTPEGYTFGAGTLITDLIAAAGGINAAAGAGYADFRQVDDAAIRTLAPDVIVLSPAWAPDQVAAFAANPAYAGVPAIQAGRVVRLPFSPTLPRDPGAAAVALALILHPAAVLLP